MVRFLSNIEKGNKEEGMGRESRDEEKGQRSSLPKKMRLLRNFQPEKVPRCQAGREANVH